MSIKNLFYPNDYDIYANSFIGNISLVNIQADNYNYLFTNKNPFFDCQITGTTTIDTNYTALNLGGGLANSQFQTLGDNTGFRYIGGLNFVSLYVSLNAYLEKIATNTYTSISLSKDGTGQPLISGTVYVDKTEGHLISFNRFISVSNNDVLRVRAQCQSGTVNLVARNVGISNAPALQLTIIGVPSQKV